MGRKTNVFLVGTMKAGTKTLMELFSRHPDVYVCPIKEPHFFVDNVPTELYEPSRFFSLENYLDHKFPESLHIANVKTEEQYQKIFSTAKDEKYLLDGSTMYLHAPGAAKKIFEYNPAAKIIILRREPLQRAYSHYCMDLGLCRTKQTFDDIIAQQIEAYYSGNLAWSTYLAMSFYDKSISKFKALFNEVLVLNFEELISDTEITAKRITEFLAISNFDEPTVKLKNKTRSLRFQKLFYYLKKAGLKDHFSRIFSVKFRQYIFRLISSEEKKPLILSNKSLEQIEEIFKKESSS